MSSGVSVGEHSFRRRVITRKRAGLLLLVLLVSTFAGYFAYQRFMAVPPSTPTVQTTTARLGSLVSTVTATGSVVSTHLAKLSFSAAGKLLVLNVAVGANVKAGQSLAKQDTAPLQSKLTSAESSLKVAQMNLEKLKEGATAEELEAAKLAYELAKVKYQEAVAGPTEADLQAARIAVDQATTNLASAQAKRDLLKAGPTQVDLASGQAGVESARTSLSTAQDKLTLLKAGPNAADLAAAQTTVQQAKTSLISAEDKYQMVQNGNLSEAGGTSNSAVQQSYYSAKASYDSAVQKLQSLQAGPTPTDLQSAQSAVTSAQASYNSAVAKLEQLKQGPTAVDLASAQSAVDQARSSLVSAQDKLSDLQAGPKEADLLSAKIALVNAQIQLAAKISVKDSDLIQQEEAVRQAQAALDQAKLDLDSATMLAPFDGIVSAVSANAGEQVASGAAVVTLVDPMAFRIDVTVDETDVAMLAVGQNATISFDALPGQQLRGKVISVAPTGNTQQGVVTYPVSIGVENPGRSFQGGMSATVNIETERKDNVVLVPNRAVRTQGRNRVVDVQIGETTETRTVQTGSSNDQMTEIISGLKQGETVVIPATTIRSSTNVPGLPGGGRSPIPMGR